MSSIEIIKSITIATAATVYILPPFLNITFFISIVLISCYSAAADPTGKPENPPVSMENPSSSGSDVRLLRRIGSGGGGTVYEAEIKATSIAVKVIDKSTRNSEAYAELEILKLLDHPFLPKLHSFVDSPDELCLLTEFCPSGNLSRLRRDQLVKRFPESSVRFYATEVVAALEYLHMLGIVHRDVKPENILIRRDGHIMLTDFDISLRCDNVVPTLVTPRNVKPARQHDWLVPSCFRPLKGKPKGKPAKPLFRFAEFVAEPVLARSMSFVGTVEYMAPEMVNGKGHGSAVDWWALGIFIYEMICGTTPFRGSGSADTMENIELKALQFPQNVEISAEAKDLIYRLLVKDQAERLGSKNGASAIKNHPFFEDVNWALLRSTTPPFVPHSNENIYCDMPLLNPL